MIRWILCVLLLWLGATPGFSQENKVPPAYLDDRSDAGALVRSFYNAINRHEYARAFSYFSTPPKDFTSFVKGYNDTVSVDVFTGRTNSDRAAGSTYSQVAVAIRATQASGETKVFSGCYTVKAVNAQIQEPPFRGLAIEKANLKAADEGVLSVAAPEWCGDGTAAPDTPEQLLERVIELFKRQNTEACSSLQDTGGPGGFSTKPEVFELQVHNAGETDKDPPHLDRLYEFTCSTYAYNISMAYYLANDSGEIGRVSFAEPHLNIRYSDGEGAVLKGMEIDGYTASDVLINSSFDAASKTLSSFNKWRGIGDSASTGTWVLRDGEFVLENYDVDATTDGEINPVTLISGGKLAK